jgi:predicted DsbA family dithiol-disulfide isomerase
LAEPAVAELKHSEPDVEIVWRAFELRPDPVPTLDPRGEYLTRVWRDAVYPLAARLGITMRLPPIQPRSRRAHEAAKWAQAQGSFDAFNAALFRAIFERGGDIANLEVLTQLAATLELDFHSLRRALDSREFEAQVLADERDAELLGITGVPAFVASRRAIVSGVQPAAVLRDMIERVRLFDTSDSNTAAPQALPSPITRRRTQDD